MITTHQTIEKQMINYRNFPMVPRVIFGRGSIYQLPQVLASRRKRPEDYVLYLVDQCFSSGQGNIDFDRDVNDEFLWVKTHQEPTTEDIDSMVHYIRDTYENLPVAVVGIGWFCFGLCQGNFCDVNQ